MIVAGWHIGAPAPKDQIFPAKVRQDMDHAYGSMVKALSDAKDSDSKVYNKGKSKSKMRLIGMGHTSKRKLFFRRTVNGPAGVMWP